MSCKPSAEAYIQRYASAMHLAQTPDVTTTSCATALATHYLPGMTIFNYGSKTTFDTQADAVTGIAAHLERFERAGWGYDIRLETSRVEAVSSLGYLADRA